MRHLPIVGLTVAPIFVAASKQSNEAPTPEATGSFNRVSDYDRKLSPEQIEAWDRNPHEPPLDALGKLRECCICNHKFHEIKDDECDWCDHFVDIQWESEDYGNYEKIERYCCRKKKCME